MAAQGVRVFDFSARSDERNQVHLMSLGEVLQDVVRLDFGSAVRWIRDDLCE
jgi:hypothetical protein